LWAQPQLQALLHLHPPLPLLAWLLQLLLQLRPRHQLQWLQLELLVLLLR
jgi:hypothetical protein